MINYIVNYMVVIVIASNFNFNFDKYCNLTFAYNQYSGLDYSFIFNKYLLYQ